MKYSIKFEINGSIVYFTSYDEEYFCSDPDNDVIRMPDNLYTEINENMFAIKNTRIRDCTEAVLLPDSPNYNERKHYCADLTEDVLVFNIGG